MAISISLNVHIGNVENYIGVMSPCELLYISYILLSLVYKVCLFHIIP